MTVLQARTVLASTTMKPLNNGTCPSGVGSGGMLTDVTNSTAPASQTFVNGAYSMPTFYAWNTGLAGGPAGQPVISAPGSYVIPVITGTPNSASGAAQATTPNNTPCVPCYNQSTPRTNYQYTANSALVNGLTGLNNGGGGASNFEFETVIVGNKVSIAWQANGVLGFSGNDTTVYVEYEGVWMKLRDLPVAQTSFTNGLVYYRHIEFERIRAWRIRIRLSPQAWFYGFYVDSKTTVYAPPVDRHCVVYDGDSYYEPAANQFDTAIYNSGASTMMTSFQTYGVVDAITEATGWWPIRIAHGGTGYWNNGGGQDTFDQYYSVNGYGNFSQFGSIQRVADMNMRFFSKGVKPLMYIMNGTQNDGAPGSGATQIANMKARAKLVYNRLRALDPYMPIVQIGNEANLRFGVAYGPNSTCANDDLGMGQAIAELAFASYIQCQPLGAALQDGWWTDNTGGNLGSNGGNSNTQQSWLIGPNGLHPCYLGALLTGGRTARVLRDFSVPAARAQMVG